MIDLRGVYYHDEMGFIYGLMGGGEGEGSEPHMA